MKNNQKIISLMYIISIVIVFIILSLFITSTFLYIVSYVFEPVFNPLSEFIFKVTNSKILLILLALYFIYNNIKAIRARPKIKLYKILFFSFFSLTIFFFYLRGESIIELKQFGFELKNRMDLYSSIKNEKPDSIDSILLPTDSQLTKVYIKNNYSYNIKEEKLYIDPDFLFVTIYYYNTTTKNFEELD